MKSAVKQSMIQATSVDYITLFSLAGLWETTMFSSFCSQMSDSFYQVTRHFTWTPSSPSPLYLLIPCNRLVVFHSGLHHSSTEGFRRACCDVISPCTWWVLVVVGRALGPKRKTATRAESLYPLKALALSCCRVIGRLQLPLHRCVWSIKQAEPSSGIILDKRG